MKRYEYDHCEGGMVEHSKGEWVRRDDAYRLAYAVRDAVLDGFQELIDELRQVDEEGNEARHSARATSMQVGGHTFEMEADGTAWHCVTGFDCYLMTDYRSSSLECSRRRITWECATRDGWGSRDYATPTQAFWAWYSHEILRIEEGDDEC